MLLRFFEEVEKAPDFNWSATTKTSEVFKIGAAFNLPEAAGFRIALPCIDIYPAGEGRYNSYIADGLRHFQSFDEDPFMPPNGSLGRIRVEIIDPLGTGIPALKFDEIHSSRGFRHIPRADNLCRAWNYWSLKNLIWIAGQIGIGEFFASTKETILTRYPRTRIMESNLHDNYVLPFKSEWRLADIVSREKEETVWHYAVQ